MQRALSTMQLLWVLGQALVDGLTRWLHDFTRHHRATSDVLRAERYLLTQELLRVSGPPLPSALHATPTEGTPHAFLPTAAALSPSPPCRAERCGGTCWTSCTPVKLK